MNMASIISSQEWIAFVSVSPSLEQVNAVSRTILSFMELIPGPVACSL